MNLMELKAVINIILNNFYISESVSFMRDNIPDGLIDLTITSPPYDNLRKYNGFIFDYQSILKELYRVTKDGGIVVWINDICKPRLNTYGWVNK